MLTLLLSATPHPDSRITSEARFKERTLQVCLHVESIVRLLFKESSSRVMVPQHAECLCA